MIDAHDTRTAPLPGIEPRRAPVPRAMLAGHHRRSSGMLVHALPGDRFDWGYIGAALCGAKPGSRSAGWAPMADQAITCARCLRRTPEGRR